MVIHLQSAHNIADFSSGLPELQPLLPSAKSGPQLQQAAFETTAPRFPVCPLTCSREQQVEYRARIAHGGRYELPLGNTDIVQLIHRKMLTEHWNTRQVCSRELVMDVWWKRCQSRASNVS